VVSCSEHAKATFTAVRDRAMANQTVTDTIERHIRKSRLFILGAGFSAAARIPMTAQLLGRAMEKFRDECLGIFKRVDGYVRTCFGLDGDPDYQALSLSEVCTFLHYVELREYGGGERWNDAGSRENLALRHYLAKTVVELTPQGDAIPEFYLRFARQLGPTDIVISFNWDCLLEAALDHIGARYSYTFDEGAVRLAKLHGSVNWRLDAPSSPRLRWTSMRFAEGMMDREVYWCRDLQDLGAWAPWDRKPLGEVQPLIVLPGFGKAFDVRHLAPLWYKPGFAFSFTHDVFIVGLSLARDDFIIRSFLADTLPYAGGDGRRIMIVNPDPVTRDNYGFLVGAPHVDFRCERFGESHVSQMETSSAAAETPR
jgi:hypothetical protein